MSKYLTINRNETDYECRDIDSNYILSGNISKTEIYEFICDLMESIRDDYCLDINNALIGVSVMSKIASECFKDNPYVESLDHPFNDAIIDDFVEERKVNVEDDMLWYIQNHSYVGLEDHLKLGFNSGDKIKKYSHLELDEYLSMTINTYDHLKGILYAYLGPKSREFYDEDRIEVKYE